MAEMVALFAEIGLGQLQETQRFDAFKGTNKEAVARKFGVMGVNLLGIKPSP